MHEDLTTLCPKELIPHMRWLGKLGNWLRIEVVDPVEFPPPPGYPADLPRTIFTPDSDLLFNAPACEEKSLVLHALNKMTGRGMVAMGMFEALGVCLTTGPKLFQPTFEQFDSLANVDLHIPVADFRSPYPVLVVRIPNEWRKITATRLGIDVQRQPLHVLLRTGTTVDGKVSIFAALHYPDGTDHYTVVTDQPSHTDLQSAIRFVQLTAEKMGIDISTFQSKGTSGYSFVESISGAEYTYCTEAVHAVLNCCLMMVHFGHQQGDYLEPRIHRLRNKTQDVARFADFKAVDMVQNVVIRQCGAVGDVPTSVINDAADGESPKLWEVRPHWRRGHWRRKIGWKAYVERGEKPPLSFVRPTLVRRDRIVGDLGESQTTYTKR